VARYLPRYSNTFRADCAQLQSFAERLEANHAQLKTPRAGLTLTGLELSYQLIFLKVFLLWENSIEQIFYRLLCGYGSNSGVEPLKPGVSFSKSIDDSEQIILGGADYTLWHNPAALLRKSDRYFDPQTSYFRGVIAANTASLTLYANIRHRIAHSQSHAQAKFDAATMTLAGRRYPGSSAGKFLRDNSTGVPPKQWLNYIIDDLYDVMHQLC
jgi:hypothetical protein